MNYHRVSDGTIEPLSYQVVRDHLRVDDVPEEETLINLYNGAARQAWEMRTGHIISDTQTWTLTLDNWFGEVEIKKSPLIAISSIQYYDKADALQTLASTNYYTFLAGHIGRIRMKAGITLPSLNEDRPGNVIITFTAGYSTPNNVPTDIKRALLLLIGHYYENRMETQMQFSADVNNVPLGFIWTSDNYRYWK